MRTTISYISRSIVIVAHILAATSSIVRPAVCVWNRMPMRTAIGCISQSIVIVVSMGAATALIVPDMVRPVIAKYPVMVAAVTLINWPVICRTVLISASSPIISPTSSMLTWIVVVVGSRITSGCNCWTHIVTGWAYITIIASILAKGRGSVRNGMNNPTLTLTQLRSQRPRRSANRTLHQSTDRSPNQSPSGPHPNATQRSPRRNLGANPNATWQQFDTHWLIHHV